ncbi:MAG: cytoplasmic protein [Ruminococcaceae bacterium]|nr:cytoplasmic protein [Oscillospiraceae bacterium]
MKKSDLVAAHRYCTNNRESLKKDSVCGCFYCLKIFSPTEITEWIKDANKTALCPYCEIDSVIGEGSGYPITKDFLGEMKKYWF